MKKEVRKRKKDRGARYLFAHWPISDSNPQSPLILVKPLLVLSRPRVQLLGPVLSVHGTRTSCACYAGMGCVQRSYPRSSRILGDWFCRHVNTMLTLMSFQNRCLGFPKRPCFPKFMKMVAHGAPLILILFSGNRQIPGLATGAVGHS